MAKQVQFRRGSTSQHSTFTGAVGEITVDTDKDTVVVHDGSTAGGNPLPTSLSDLGVTATASELNTLDGVPATLTATELGYVDGVTSAIQTQIDGKQDVVANVSSTEIGYLDGVTSAIQTQLDAKVDLAGDTMTGALILNADPTAALGAATKSYVDTIAAAGIHYHTAVRVESPSNLNATYDNGTSGVGATLTNAGTQAAISIDGVALSLNDRVLVYNQTNAAHNGIYTVTTVGDGASNWVLTRATDADSYGASDSDALGEGDAFFVKEGDTGAGELYVMSTSGTITFGTTAINFTVIAETAVYTAGTDITLDGTTFNLNSTIAADTTGNAATATAWETGRTISLTGDVTGTATGVDGSGNVSITTTVTSPYADSDVDTHLNTGTASSGEFLSWNGSDYDWASASVTLADLGVTASAADLNTTDVTTLGTAEANKVVTADASANVSFPSNIEVGNYISHVGDSDTWMQFQTDGWRVQTGSQLTITANANGVQLGDTGNGYFRPVSGGYGSIEIDGGGHTGYEGYSIGGRVAFLHDNNVDGGLWDDLNDEWLLRYQLNDKVMLYHNGTTKLQTRSDGVQIDGTLFVQESIAEDYDALSGTTPTCNLDNAGAFSLTMTGNTTFTFSGATSSYSQSFILQLTGNGSTVTWPSSVDWAGGTAPDAPASGETDLLVFWTRDGGSTWYGMLAIDAAA